MTISMRIAVIRSIAQIPHGGMETHNKGHENL